MTDEHAQSNQGVTCECRAEEIVLLPCSGGSNCGQIANSVAVRLTQDGAGRIYCLAGIGAHIEGMIESARAAKRIMAIDGCDVACAKKTLEHAGLPVTDWICVTGEGIEKNHNFALSHQHIDSIARRVQESLARPPA
ncbi:MAG: putative zinc-binding protein [Dehalococcoidia bacterium]